MVSEQEPGFWDLEHLKDAHGLNDWMFTQFADYVSGRVLEVGAGIGTFTELLLTRPVAEVFLMEPNAACVEVLQGKFFGRSGVYVLAESLPDAPSLFNKQGAIDFVLCQNVLEHIEDDVGALSAITRVLRPGGRLGLLVPAHPRLFGELDDVYGHFRRYTKPLVRERLEAAGLIVDDLYSFNAVGIPGWWVQNHRGAGGIGPASLFAYEVLLRGWRPIEERWRPPWGLSAIALARKP